MTRQAVWTALKPAVVGTSIAVPLGSLLSGPVHAAVHGQRPEYGFVLSLFVFVWAFWLPYFWGLLTAVGHCLIGSAIRTLRSRLESRAAAMVLGAGMGLLLAAFAIVFFRVLTRFETPQEIAGKWEAFLPLWIYITAVAAAIPSGAVVGALSWKKEETKKPLPMWLLGTIATYCLSLSYGVYFLTWELGPLYVRVFDL